MNYGRSRSFAAFRCIVAGVAWIISGFVQAQGPVQLTPSRVIPTPNGSAAIASADILGTPHEEIVTATGGDLSIADTAVVGPPTVTLVNIGSYVAALTTGDVDQDGLIDIVCRTVDPALKVVKNLGGGNFTVSTLSTSSTQPVHLADLTGDGFLDIVCGGHRWTNDGTGAFPTSIVFTPGTTLSPIDVLPGDFDGDGDQDLISVYYGTIAAGTGTIARLFRQTASGTLTQLTATLLDPLPSSFLHVADFNQDGRDDVLMSTSILSAYPYHSGTRYRTFLGQSGPVIVPQAATIVNQTPTLNPVVADWNNDGFLDLAVPANTVRGTLTLTTEQRFGVLVNDGTGILNPAMGLGLYDISPLATVESIWSACATDDDLDGDVDLLIVQPTRFSVFLNDSATASPVATQVTDPAAGKIVARWISGSTTFDVTLSTTSGGPPVPIAGHFVMVDFFGPTGTPYRLTSITSSTGQVTFTLPTGYASTSIPIEISTPEGPIGTFSLLTAATLIVTAGGGQSVYFGMPFAPLTGQILDSNAVPIEGVRVFVAVSGAPTAVTLADGVSDAAGNFTINGVAGFPGTASCSFYVPQAFASPTFQLTSPPVASVVTITQGAGQVACSGMPIVPIVGTVLTQFGTPLVGYTVAIAPTGPNGSTPITFNSSTTQTDANGVFTFTGVGNPVTTTRGYAVTVSGITAFASFNLSSQLTPILSVVSGQGQAIDHGEVLPSPIVVAVIDCFGAPVVGATVNLLPQTSGVAVPSSTLITDAMGRVSFVPTFSNIGIHRVRVTLGAAMTETSTIVRGLATVNVGLFLAISFQHDHAGVPLLLAVDTPPASPYLSTPYGDIWTTILAPQPTLFYLDGFGLFGSIDPGMTTGPQGTWLRTYPLQPEFYNVTFVVQMYGYDALNAFPDDYVVSNPAYFTL